MKQSRESSTNSTLDINALAFESALSELEDIVRRLEQGQISLDDAINSYERGALLKQHCEKKLEQARMRVEKISFGSEGAQGTDPADLE